MLRYRRLRYGYPFRRIRLTQGRFAIVDPEDYEALSRHKWCAAKDGNTYYAVRSQAYKQIRMHREILKVGGGLVCDHINHDGLDNRKANVRICTRQQNSRNRRAQEGTTSRYKGVDWNKRLQKWRARIYLNGRARFLGYFSSEIEAAKAYDRAARKYHGEFASLNFPELDS